MSADAYYTLTCPCTLFSPVCPAFIGRVARYTPSPARTYRQKTKHISISNNCEHLLKGISQLCNDASMVLNISTT